MSPGLRLASRLGAVATAAVALSTAGCAQSMRSTQGREPTAAEMAELWVEPEDIRKRDLFDGPGGPGLRPKPGTTYQFLEKDTKWYSWGWDVKDPSGMEWSAKYGPEARSEVVVSRLVWAVGYHQPPTYYVEHWSLAGSDEDGPKTPCRFRPDTPGRKNRGEWSWARNPFVGTRPFGGLITLMRMVNNWDLLDRNNVIYEFKEPAEGARRWYVVKDLGASLGKTSGAGPLSGRQGSKNVVEDFEKQDFIRGVKGDRVEFDDSGYRHRELYRDVTVADVRWICERLNRLTPEQWKDAFRAARYPDDVADRYIRKIQEKIAYGLSLPAGS
jgi:hypothetical protein